VVIKVLPFNLQAIEQEHDQLKMVVEELPLNNFSFNVSVCL